ncbi:MAG: hypothetical protein J6P43_04135 [Succinivibrionaceae bacterium]|nr:hypothetical protein [Succinivibrionaceae bacterium]
MKISRYMTVQMFSMYRKSSNKSTVIVKDAYSLRKKNTVITQSTIVNVLMTKCARMQ